MVKTLFFVPLVDNEGTPFLPADWSALEHRLWLLAEGFSRRDGVQGAWKDNDGSVHTGENREFTIALTSWTQLAEWLETVQWAKAHFRQLAIYLEVNGSPEIL